MNLNALNSLNAEKGAIFIKKCAQTITEPLYIILNLSVNTFGIYPDVWKIAKIIPIHKSGSRLSIENYRPISILNTFSKVFEKIIYKAIHNIISNSLPDEQHGFINKRSTITNLTVFTNYVLQSMDGGAQVDVIYTDFEKAFDRVDHTILLHKLQLLGIRGDLHRWFCSYITNRRQAVAVGSARSDFVHISSGVPQGSILGPLLYNAYLYDINSSIKDSNYLMFADDKKIYLKINKEGDCQKIQADLNNLSNYYRQNRISVNTSKCVKITFTRKKNKIDFSYHINNKSVKEVDCVRDLGIWLDYKMTYNNHIDTIVDKAYKQLGVVRRVSEHFHDVDCMKVLYYTYVRSILEYGCSVWSPSYTVHKEKIEKTS
ncbi:unnamed protein product [Pieris macdunnoughi]|uniref:Reverse transcriptase domain-containing protein n=1 Tax=Pieris macdunnoughi TaxID=345717 RepID=A0A821LSU3_9NEOP|nr:unnamed protein product [Pieris macdunnoughi]